MVCKFRVPAVSMVFSGLLGDVVVASFLHHKWECGYLLPLLHIRFLVEVSFHKSDILTSLMGTGNLVGTALFV